MLDVNIALVLNLRVILGKGQIMLVGDISLNQNDIIGLFYIPGGLNLNLNLTAPVQPGVLWSMFYIN